MLVGLLFFLLYSIVVDCDHFTIIIYDFAILSFDPSSILLCVQCGYVLCRFFVALLCNSTYFPWLLWLCAIDMVSFFGRVFCGIRLLFGVCLCVFVCDSWFVNSFIYVFFFVWTLLWLIRFDDGGNIELSIVNEYLLSDFIHSFSDLSVYFAFEGVFVCYSQFIISTFVFVCLFSLLHVLSVFVQLGLYFISIKVILCLCRVDDDDLCPPKFFPYAFSGSLALTMLL